LIGDLFSGALGLIEDIVSCGERDHFTNLLIDKERDVLMPTPWQNLCTSVRSGQRMAPH
jgi:hypothetical protein